MTEQQQTPRVQKALAALAQRDDAVLRLGQQMLTADEGRLYPVDLLAKAALKRALRLSAAFRLLIEHWNLVAARALLRMQLDTAARFSAAWLVGDPHRFALDVIGGTRIDKLTDRNGKRLTDRHLMDTLGQQYEWVPRVYEFTCGYVHLSEAHLFSTTLSVDESQRSIQFFIGAEDTHMPEFSFLETVECFTEATDIVLKYVAGWSVTKGHPELLEQEQEPDGSPTKPCT